MGRLEICVPNGGASVRPGENIGGWVDVYSNKGARMRQLTVRFAGKECATVPPPDANPNSPRQSVHFSEVDTKIVNAQSDPVRLPSGLQRFAFTVRVPEGLPPTLRLPYASIQYELTGIAVVESKYGFFEGRLKERVASVAVEVLPGVIDQAIFTNFRHPVIGNQRKDFSLPASGSATLEVIVPRGYYFPGEQIELQIRVQNYSQRKIEYVKCYFSREVTVTVNGVAYRRQERLLKQRLEQVVRPKTHAFMTLFIPCASPVGSVSCHSRLIDVRFTVSVRLGVAWAKDVATTVPIEVVAHPVVPPRPVQTGAQPTQQAPVGGLVGAPLVREPEGYGPSTLGLPVPGTETHRMVVGGLAAPSAPPLGMRALVGGAGASGDSAAYPQLLSELNSRLPGGACGTKPEVCRPDKSRKPSVAPRPQPRDAQAQPTVPPRGMYPDLRAVEHEHRHMQYEEVEDTSQRPMVAPRPFPAQSSRSPPPRYSEY